MAHPHAVSHSSAEAGEISVDRTACLAAGVEDGDDDEVEPDRRHVLPGKRLVREATDERRLTLQPHRRLLLTGSLPIKATEARGQATHHLLAADKEYLENAFLLGSMKVDHFDRVPVGHVIIVHHHACRLCCSRSRPHPGRHADPGCSRAQRASL